MLDYLSKYLISKNKSFLEMWKHLSVITDEVRVGHEGQFLTVLLSKLDWGGDCISDQIVHKGSTACPWVA